MSYGLYLVVLCIATCYYGFAFSSDKYSPRITEPEVYDFTGIKLTWGPPEEIRNTSLENYIIKWKNSTDGQYKFSEKISKDKATIVQVITWNYTLYATTFLTYYDNRIKPCSSFDVEVSAIFNDSSSTFTNITIETGMPKGPVLHSIFCSSNSTSQIEVILEPPPKDFYSACNFTFNYVVRAEGFSQWNNDREEIPRFEASENFILSGLSPNTEYHIYVTEKSTSAITKCNVTTLVEGPSPVILGKVFSSSPTSIFASWSPPAKPYGQIKKYWIKTIRTKDNSKRMIEVQSSYTRVILQNLRPGSEYKIVVWAENEAGIGEGSEEVTVSTI